MRKRRERVPVRAPLPPRISFNHTLGLQKGELFPLDVLRSARPAPEDQGAQRHQAHRYRFGDLIGPHVERQADLVCEARYGRCDFGAQVGRSDQR